MTVTSAFRPTTIIQAIKADAVDRPSDHDRKLDDEQHGLGKGAGVSGHTAGNQQHAGMEEVHDTISQGGSSSSSMSTASIIAIVVSVAIVLIGCLYVWKRTREKKKIMKDLNNKNDGLFSSLTSSFASPVLFNEGMVHSLDPTNSASEYNRSQEISFMKTSSFTAGGGSGTKGTKSSDKSTELSEII